MAADPLDYLIEIFGGKSALARAIGVDPSNITRWKMSREEDRRGHGGRLPPQFNAAIIEAADAAGISREEIAPHLEEAVCPCCGGKLAPGQVVSRLGGAR